jgi:hypothetical protein
MKEYNKKECIDNHGIMSHLQINRRMKLLEHFKLVIKKVLKDQITQIDRKNIYCDKKH